ncbi:uncharacterized protein METZ01_LOCUS165948 [marine metagenome]|uniref:Uncharacterized protein n=1 Tax=marine metagenome TaxID=408172 RepID=A0A382BHF7_9ZZZZ
MNKILLAKFLAVHPLPRPLAISACCSEPGSGEANPSTTAPAHPISHNAPVVLTRDSGHYRLNTYIAARAVHRSDTFHCSKSILKAGLESLQHPQCGLGAYIHLAAAYTSPRVS